MKKIAAGAPLPRGLITHRVTGWRVRIALSTTAILLALLALGSSGHAQSESVIAVFGKQQTGSFPNGVIADNGILFGTSWDGGPNDFGTVFALRPPATPGGPWRKAILYTFNYGPSGFQPKGFLLAGANHVLYGVASPTVFALQPPAGGGTPWIETPLYTFGSRPFDAWGQSDGLIADANGTLYGATLNGGSGPSV